MLLTGYLVGNVGQPQEARGDFVVGDQHRTEGWAMSSAIGAFPWYYSVTLQGELVQGENVFDVCTAAKLDWDWNTTAIRQIATVGHTLGSHTLHSRIFRLPSHSKVRLENGLARLESVDPMSGWDWDSNECDSTFRTLTDAFEACLADTREPILSLSAGFDSRLLLALCLHFGCSPSLVSMGSPQSTDPKVAAILAKQAGLKLERIDLAASDYLKHGEEISRRTSGVKTASDWHTWLYNKHLNAPDRIHLVGSNGEFARTFFSHALTRSAIFRRAGRLGASTYLSLRALNRSRKYPRDLGFNGPAATWSVIELLRLSRQNYPTSALACLDTFYATERVRHFIGAGLACYSQFSKPRSPFLDTNWMKSIAAMRRSWKEHNRYHVAAISKCRPRLLDTLFNKDPDGAPQSYSPFSALSQSNEVDDMLIESAPLDFLLNRDARIRALRDVKSDKVSVVSLLLTMHFASLNAKRVATDRAASAHA